MVKLTPAWFPIPQPKKPVDERPQLWLPVPPPVDPDEPRRDEEPEQRGVVVIEL